MWCCPRNTFCQIVGRFSVSTQAGAALVAGSQKQAVDSAKYGDAVLQIGEPRPASQDFLPPCWHLRHGAAGPLRAAFVSQHHCLFFLVPGSACGAAFPPRAHCPSVHHQDLVQYFGSFMVFWFFLASVWRRRIVSLLCLRFQITKMK